MINKEKGGAITPPIITELTLEVLVMQSYLSRKNAQILGFKRYFTGRPCRRGHIVERYVSSGKCIECQRLNGKQDRLNNPEKIKLRQKRWRAANPEKRKEYSENNKKHIKEQKRQYHKDNKKHIKERKKQYRKDNKKYISKQNKQYRKNHKEEAKQYGKQWRLDNPEKIRTYRKRHYQDNKGKRAESNKQWNLNNPAKRAEYARDYYWLKTKAIPAWANSDIIKGFYHLRNLMTLIHNKPYEVDHIVPLQGVNVCGLHTHTNLQVLTQSENASKGNRF